MITATAVVIWVAYVFFLYFMIFWLLVFIEEPLEDSGELTENFPLITVAVPAYNEEKTVAGTINSILELDYPKDKMEIIVINDGSKDNTKEIVEGIIKENPDFSIRLFNQRNQGKGVAMNRALANAIGEYFVPLDADSFIRSDALKKLLPHFNDEERIAAVLPLMKVKDPQNLLQKIQWAEYMVNLFYKRLMSILDCVQVAPGPFSVYKKEVLRYIGGFHEKNLTEDLEITLRMQKYHYKIKQVTTTEVYTIAPKTLKQFYYQRNRWYKGTILNALSYRKMVFNKKYGDFGFIQMPRLLLEGVLVVSALSFLLYKMVFKPLYYKFYNYSLINFDVLPFIAESFGNIRILDLDFVSVFYSLVVVLFAGVLLYYAHKYNNEKFTKRSLISVPAYLIFYSFLASFALVGVFFDLLRGKVQKW
jgi:cellulose synthase/poly-beta-1,6-N-acetylglucosamine synthase-like glycosyltransferase